MGKKFGISFSAKRALGISSMKSKIARVTGIPTTRQGRQRKFGSTMGCSFVLFIFISIFSLSICFADDIKNINYNSEIQLLEQKVDLLNSNNDKILTTTYWALEAIVGVIIAVVALQFWQNFQINKKKIDELKNETKQDLKKSFDELEKNKQQIKENLEKEVENKINIESKKINNNIINLKENLNDLKRDFCLSEFKKNNFYIDLFDVIEIDINRKYDFLITQDLDILIDFIKNEKNINTDFMVDMEKLLSKLPPSFYSINEKIKKELELKK